MSVLEGALGSEILLCPGLMFFGGTFQGGSTFCLASMTLFHVGGVTLKLALRFTSICQRCGNEKVGWVEFMMATLLCLE